MTTVTLAELTGRPTGCPFTPHPVVERGRDAGEPLRLEPTPMLPGREDVQPHVLTRHGDVRAVLADPRFSGERAGSPTTGDDPVGVAAPWPGMLLLTDPPAHTPLRRALGREFTVRRVEGLRPAVVRIVEQALDDLEQAGPGADLVAHFALPVPSLVICELLGVPYADRADFQRRSGVMLDMSEAEDVRRRAQQEMLDYTLGLVARRRAEPADDLISRLVAARGGEADDVALATTCNLLLTAGHETTAHTIGLGTLLLLQNPGQLELVRDRPEAVGPAVEEILRQCSVVASTVPRRATADVDLGGRLIRAGEDVVCHLLAANRDPALLEDPAGLDVTRPAPPHVTFGYGIHQCLGQQLARLELGVALPALLRRFPGLHLAGDTPPATTTGAFTFGLTSLPVGW